MANNGKLPNTGGMKPMPYKPGTGRTIPIPNYKPGTGRAVPMPYRPKPTVDARDVFEKTFDTVGPMAQAVINKRGKK